MEFVNNEPIYTEFLQHVKGISGVLSANLIKYFGYCEKAPHISSLWKYSGLAVVDGEAPKLRHGKKIDFNPKCRTLAWKIGDSFIKQRTPIYRKIYDAEKKRQLYLLEKQPPKKSKPESASEPSKTRKPSFKSEPPSQSNPSRISVPKNKMHVELRARRKMVKIFLANYWQASKELSQSVIETQSKQASQGKQGTHRGKASQIEKETHYKVASQGQKATQRSLASPYAQSKLGHKHIINWREVVKANLAIRKSKI